VRVFPLNQAVRFNDAEQLVDAGSKAAEAVWFRDHGASWFSRTRNGFGLRETVNRFTPIVSGTALQRSGASWCSLEGLAPRGGRA
jgi:hypothetical protein